MRFFKILAASALLLLTSLGLSAQNRTVTGKVLDEAGLPVPGVGVVLDGTTNGTVTNEDGSWSLSVPNRDVTLVFSSLGYSMFTEY